MAESILLGHAPRPTDGAQLAKRIRTLVIAAEPAGIACTSIIDAELDGADIARLHLDLTGFVFAGEVDRDRARLEPQGASVRWEAAEVRDLRVHASPIHISGVEVPLDVALRDVQFVWIETDNGELAIEFVAPSADRPLHGRARVSVPKEQLGRAALGLAESLLLDKGIAVSKLDVDVQASGPRALRLTVDARVRKGLLGATVRGTASVSIDERMGVTLSDVCVDSANPLVGVMLGAFRGRIERLEGRCIELASALPAGIRVADLHVSVADAVTIEARLT